MIALQVAGSIAILAGFGLAQLGRIDTSGWTYLWVNSVGSIALGIPALVTGQWGFVLLESCWLAVSLVGIVRRLSRDKSDTRASMHKATRATP
jgi:hypothetical protein